VGAQNYQVSQLIRPENDDDSEFEDESDEEPDSTQEVIKIVNVHKTYLLGIEGVPALRGVNVTV
jgi:putative ABC transport system ATP-binding protein